MKMCISGSLAVKTVTQESRAMEVEEMKPQGAFALKSGHRSSDNKYVGLCRMQICSVPPILPFFFQRPITPRPDCLEREGGDTSPDVNSHRSQPRSLGFGLGLVSLPITIFLKLL
jgi:hypothetical protein